MGYNIKGNWARRLFQPSFLTNPTTRGAQFPRLRPPTNHR